MKGLIVSILANLVQTRFKLHPEVVWPWVSLLKARFSKLHITSLVLNQILDWFKCMPAIVNRALPQPCMVLPYHFGLVLHSVWFKCMPAIVNRALPSGVHGFTVPFWFGIAFSLV